MLMTKQLMKEMNQEQSVYLTLENGIYLNVAFKEIVIKLQNPMCFKNIKTLVYHRLKEEKIHSDVTPSNITNYFFFDDGTGQNLNNTKKYNVSFVISYEVKKQAERYLDYLKENNYIKDHFISDRPNKTALALQWRVNLKIKDVYEVLQIDVRRSSDEIEEIISQYLNGIREQGTVCMMLNVYNMSEAKQNNEESTIAKYPHSQEEIALIQSVLLQQAQKQKMLEKIEIQKRLESIY